MKHLVLAVSLIFIAITACTENKVGPDIESERYNNDIASDQQVDVPFTDVAGDMVNDKSSHGTMDTVIKDQDETGPDEVHIPDAGAADGHTQAGKPCGPDYQCDPGLMCGIEDICLDADDFNTGDMDQKCRILDSGKEFCYEGLTCNVFGRCELDCSPGNDILCTANGNFDFGPYAGKYKLKGFDETKSCGSNDFVPRNGLDYTYFELKLKNYYGFKYLAFHTCKDSSDCSDYEKSGYKIVDVDGQTLMDFATENDDGSCTYTSINTYIRKAGKRVMIRYVFNEVTVKDANNCDSSEVSSHYGEMTCKRIRIINGEQE